VSEPLQYKMLTECQAPRLKHGVQRIHDLLTIEKDQEAIAQPRLFGQPTFAAAGEPVIFSRSV
jgi:hypothetical protein